MYAQLMLEELRKVIPSFLVARRPPRRGGAWTDYLAKTRDDTGDLVPRIFADDEPEPAGRVTLARLGSRRRGQGARRDLLPAHEPARGAAARPGAPAPRRRPHRARARVRGGAQQPPAQARARVRAHRLPLRRARRLRRVPRPAAAPDADDRVAAAHTAPRLRDARAGASKPGSTHALRRRDGTLGRRSTTCSSSRSRSRPRTRCHSAYRMRYVMQMNAREAMHLCELRSSPQGHPTYRRIAQEMHRQIAEQAGHRAIAAAMRLRRPRNVAISNVSTRSARPKRDASSAAERHALRHVVLVAQSLTEHRRASRAEFIADFACRLTMHRRALVLVIRRAPRLDSNGVAEAYYRRPGNTAGRELRRMPCRGRGERRGFGGCPGGLSRERCDNPSASGRPGHPAAPTVSWTRPPTPSPPPTPRCRGPVVRLHRTASPALYSAPPRGCAVRNVEREAFRRHRGRLQACSPFPPLARRHRTR